MKNITASTDERGVMTAVLDMPGRPFNVFSEDMMADLSALLDDVEGAIARGNPPKGLVITSGKTSFVAGADLAMIQDFGAMRFHATWQEMRDRYSYLGKLFRRLENLPLPVVAAINGLALGGGLELAMACHRRVCVEGAVGMLGLPEVLLGLLPGAGGTQRLPRLVGLKLGTQMLLNGNPLKPDRALEVGLVDAVVSSSSLIEKAKELVLDIEPGAIWDKPDYQAGQQDLQRLDGSFGTWSLDLAGISEQYASLYPAVSAIQSCIRGGFDKPIDTACDIEWDIFVDLMSDPIASNMVTTCFISKTAATKRSASQLPSVSVPEAYTLLGDIDLGEKPFKKLTQQTGGGEAFQISGPDAVTESIGLAVVRLDLEESVDTQQPVLRLTERFAQQEVLELAAGNSDDATALALAVLSRSGKSVVVTKSATSVNSLLISEIRRGWEQSGLSPSLYVSKLSALELDGLARRALPQAVEIDRTAADREFSLQVLVTLCQTVYQWISPQLDESKSQGDIEALLAGTDLLAVYGVSFPKWTGGPLSCISMFQRGELAGDNEAATLSAVEWAFKGDQGYQLQSL